MFLGGCVLQLSFLCPPFQHSWEPPDKLKHILALYRNWNLMSHFHFCTFHETHNVSTTHHGLLNGEDSTIWNLCSCCNTLKETDPDWWKCSMIVKVPKGLQRSIAHLKWCVSLSAGVRLLKPLSSFLLRIDGADFATEHYHVICLVSFSFPNSKQLRKCCFIVCHSFHLSVVVLSVGVWISSTSKQLLHPVKGIVYSIINGL